MVNKMNKNLYRRSIRALKKKQGICTNCLSRRAIRNKAQCLVCSSKNRARQKTILDQCAVYNKKYYNKTKLSAILKYGGKCTCGGCSWHDGVCSVIEINVLTVDHINGGGVNNIKTGKEYRLTRWLKVNNYPPGFQVLCANCHLDKNIKTVPRKYKHDIRV